ncbi:ankyrin repeat domain-containing protein [Candidatus Dependentiae bacterium]
MKNNIFLSALFCVFSTLFLINTCIYAGKIHDVILAENTEGLKKLISQDPECVNQKDEISGKTPLHYACEAPNFGLEMVCLLLEAGAEKTINAKCLCLSSLKEDITPLFLAVNSYLKNLSPDRKNVINILITRGAIIDEEIDFYLGAAGYEYPKGYGPTKQEPTKPEEKEQFSPLSPLRSAQGSGLLRASRQDENIEIDQEIISGLNTHEIVILKKLTEEQKLLEEEKKDELEKEYWRLLAKLLQDEHATLSVLKDKGYRNLEDILFAAAKIEEDYKEHIIEKIAPQLESEYRKTNKQYNREDIIKKLTKSKKPTNRRIIMDTFKEAIRLDPKTKLFEYLDFGILSEEEIKTTVEELKRERNMLAPFYFFNSSI